MIGLAGIQESLHVIHSKAAYRMLVACESQSKIIECCLIDQRVNHNKNNPWLGLLWNLGGSKGEQKISLPFSGLERDKSNFVSATFRDG